MSAVTRSFAVLLLAPAALSQGSALCAVDDVNGDGVRDLAVASRERDQPEIVWLLSGKDGALLRSWRSTTPNEGFGAALSLLGDLDDDGCRELGIVVAGGTIRFEGTPIDWDGWTPAGTSRAVVCSPKSGSVLREFLTPAKTSAGTPSVTSVGDWNHDGVDDVAIGLQAPGGARASSVRVVSGKDGTMLFVQESEVSGSDHEDDFGAAVVGPGDLDGDEMPDLIVGAPTRRSSDGLRRPTIVDASKLDPSKPGQPAPNLPLTNDVGLDGEGCVLLISGKSGERIAGSFGDQSDDMFGAHLTLLPDLDADGHREIAAVAPSRYVRVLSYDAKTRTFRTLCSIGSHCGRGYTDEFGSSVCVLPDVDGDGKPELVIGANEPWPPGFFDEGYAEVWSAATGKRIQWLATSRTEGIDACGLDDIDGDHIPEVALSKTVVIPKEAWCTGQVVRVVSAKDGTKVVWERTIASLRAVPTSK